MTAKKKRSKVIFAGTGLGWFPMPRYFLGNKDNRGKFFEMDPSPGLRLYAVLLSESGKEENRVVTLNNGYLMEFAKLNRTYLPRARNGLVKAKLIRATRVGMKSYRYEILGAEGRSLSDKTRDEWGLHPDFEFEFQT